MHHHHYVCVLSSLPHNMLQSFHSLHTTTTMWQLLRNIQLYTSCVTQRDTPQHTCNYIKSTQLHQIISFSFGSNDSIITSVSTSISTSLSAGQIHHKKHQGQAPPSPGWWGSHKHHKYQQDHKHARPSNKKCALIAPQVEQELLLAFDVLLPGAGCCAGRRCGAGGGGAVFDRRDVLGYPFPSCGSVKKVWMVRMVRMLTVQSKVVVGCRACMHVPTLQNELVLVLTFVPVNA